MSTNKQALREAAEIATPGPWYVHDKPCEDGNYGIDTSDKEFLAEAVVWWGFARQSIWREEDAKFIAAANPATVLALLDELEAAEQTSAARLEAIDRTHKMFQRERDRADAAEKRIADLEAREVVLPKAISVLHRSDFIDAHRAIYAYPEAEVNAALAAAGITVKGDSE